MNSKNTQSFSLNNIANWQLNSDKYDKVELPSLQRSFVWKVNQIEALWDSILRGFPIGALLLSKTENENFYLLDGQQRATSITLGYYDPWYMEKNEKNKFWSLKNIPIVWIDLAPTDFTNTQKFVIRVVTQSHPWGYQRKNNNSILSVSDRRNALANFRKNPSNQIGGYIKLSLLNVYPYDSNLPVPLSFLIKAVLQNEMPWEKFLIAMCETYLPVDYIKTKHNLGSYIEQLIELVYNTSFDDNILTSVKNLSTIEIPAIIVKKEILKSEDQSGEDSTLFVRLNSSGTKISGEELIYSIYKASFPEAKKLVENMGANFVAPSIVISLVARLASSEINNNAYPSSINVNDFQKRIRDDKFKVKLNELIGTKDYSPAGYLFSKAFDILLSNDNLNISPVLVKNIVKGSTELFLLLLQWLKLNDKEIGAIEKLKILGTITALGWFGKDNTKYVREIWSNLHVNSFWNIDILSIPYLNKHNPIMYPLVQPSILRKYLLKEVVEKNTPWNILYPNYESQISNQFKYILPKDITKESEIINSIKLIWDSFINRMFRNKSLILFAQRVYVNESFGDFNQMETLEDTNTPWDWDHIYPDSWVYYQQNVSQLTRHWNHCIGNLRAISLEENRSQNNNLSPRERLSCVDVRIKSFVNERDWKYWSEISNRINDEDNQMIKNHLNAIIERLCSIYENWYFTLKVQELFNFDILESKSI